jgi:hypothetical protein
MIQVNQEGQAAASLVSTIRQLNIEVPEAVTAALNSYRGSMKVREHAQREYDSAFSDLQFVELDKMDGARQRVVDAWVRLSATTEVETAFTNAAGRRLNHQVFDITPEWESAVVERFNETVDYYELNRVSGDLPNFNDPRSFNVLSLTKQQGHAADRWREAADHLHPLWSAYRRLAGMRDHEIGPVSANDRSINLFTACVLGDPGSFGRADAAATRFASIEFGSTSAGAYAAINPFVVPALVGYNLKLHTLQTAATVRSRVQNI